MEPFGQSSDPVDQVDAKIDNLPRFRRHFRGKIDGFLGESVDCKPLKRRRAFHVPWLPDPHTVTSICTKVGQAKGFLIQRVPENPIQERVSRGVSLNCPCRRSFAIGRSPLALCPELEAGAGGREGGGILQRM